MALILPVISNSLWAINPNSASFTGGFSNAPVDRNRDGLYDKLAVNVEIKVTQPATYTVIAQLLVGDKLVDSSSSGLAALDVGTHTSNYSLMASTSTIRQRCRIGCWQCADSGCNSW